MGKTGDMTEDELQAWTLMMVADWATGLVQRGMIPMMLLGRTPPESDADADADAEADVVLCVPKGVTSAEIQNVLQMVLEKMEQGEITEPIAISFRKEQPHD